MVTVLYLSATFAAAGSLAAGFAKYFGELWELPPTLLVMIVFILFLAFINYIGITESVVMNMLMTFVELSGLIIVMVIGIWYVAEGDADFGIAGAKNMGVVYSKGQALRKVPQEQLVDVLFEEIDKYATHKRIDVDAVRAAEGAEWLAAIEAENAGEMTPERLAALEAADREELAAGEAEALAALAVRELQREHTHHQQVRAVNALVRLREHRAYAEQLRPFRRPVAR